MAVPDPSASGRQRDVGSLGGPALRRAPARWRVSVAAGGTAGHVYPGLAIAEAFREDPEFAVSFIGCARGLECDLVPRFGFDLDLVDGRPFVGASFEGKLRSLWALGRAARETRQILQRRQSDLVVSLGGYVGAAAVLGAKSAGIASVLHEANVVPGLGNTLSGRLADRIYLGLEESAPRFSARSTMVTGTPVREDVLYAARQRSPRLDERLRILVTGGSLGAEFLNAHAPTLAASLGRRGFQVEVRHQVGRHALEPIAARYRQAGVRAEVAHYLEPMADSYAWADLGITRCGASTLAELAVMRLPSLIVPLPGHARDHQQANSEVFSAGGAAVSVREERWDAERLADRLSAWIRDRSALARCRQELGRLARPAAAQAIVEDCRRLLLASRP